MAQIHTLEVAPQTTAFHYFDRRYRHRLVEHVARIGAKTARRIAADVVLVQGIGHPAENASLPEYRAGDLHIGLMARADPRVVGQKHVAFGDAGFRAEILQRPFDRQVHGAGEILNVRAEEDELAIFGEDDGIKVVGNTCER